jgi:hypothetical protein
MACAGVVASAGAQIDFTIMTVGRRITTVSAGKFTSTYFHYGFVTGGSQGSVTKSNLETANNTSHALLQLEHVSHSSGGTVGMNLSLQGTVADTDVAGFRTLALSSNTNFLRSDRASYGTATNSVWNWSYSGTLLASAYSTGTPIIVELRADNGI